MLPGNTPALFGGASLGNDAFTVLLLHADGPNGSTQMLDYSPTLKGLATFVGNATISSSGKFGSGSIINPGGGYVAYPSHADFNFGAGDFTIDWWEYRTGGGCALARDLPSTYTPFLISFGAARQVYMSSNNAAWDIASARTFGTVTNNVWAHLAITRSGNTFRTFLNGVQQDTWTSSLALWDNTNPLCIGAAQNANNFVGYIDELRISKGIARWIANFTPPTIPYAPDPDFSVKLLLHMDGGTNSIQFIDASTTVKGLATVRGGAKVDTAQSKFGQAVLLGGTNGLQYPTNVDWDFGAGEFTIDFWVRLSAYPTNSWAAALARILNGNDLNNRWWVAIHSSGGVEFDAYHMPGPTMDVGLMAGNIPLNTWKHVAVVRSGNTVTIYVDGVAAGSAAYSGTLPAISGPLNIGIGDAANNFPITGWMDELRITKGKAQWTANFTPPAVPYTPVGTPGAANVNTKSLLHFDGSLADAASGQGSNGVHTWTNNGAGITIPAKFGSSALDVTYDGIFTPAHADFYLTGDFTIDFWTRATFTEDGLTHNAVCYGIPNTQAFVLFVYGGSPPLFIFQAISDGSSPFIELTFNAYNLVGDIYQHVAVTRSGNTWRLFLDGTMMASQTISGTPYNTGQNLAVGCASNNVNTWGGMIDEFRITKGVALWTANFTPPTSPGVVT